MRYIIDKTHTAGVYSKADTLRHLMKDDSTITVDRYNAIHVATYRASIDAKTATPSRRDTKQPRNQHRN